MKILASCCITCLILIATIAVTPKRRESCSCTADDGSCSASVSCKGGCIAYCPSNGCRAVCKGSSFEESGSVTDKSTAGQDQQHAESIETPSLHSTVTGDNATVQGQRQPESRSQAAISRRRKGRTRPD